MATDLSNQQLVEAIVAKPLEDRRSIMAALMEALVLGGPIAAPAVGKGGKAAKDPSAPKREANWWIKSTVRVRAILKDIIEADNAERAERAEAKVAGTAPTTVARMLKDAGQYSKEAEATEEQILAMYEEFKANPPAPKSASASVASKGSSAGSAKTKFSELSPEEQKARRSEAAKKAAATRKANKAAREAAEGGDAASVSSSVDKVSAEIEDIITAAKAKKAATPKAPTPKAPAPIKAPAEEEEAEPAEFYEWEHNFGKASKMYIRADHEGRAYIYNEADDGELEYLGVWVEETNKLNKAVKDFRG